MNAKILIADNVSEAAEKILMDAGLLVDVKTGRTEDAITADIAHYDGIIVRSATKVTRRIIEAGTKLKVIGRAGVGVDNIDREAATAHGIVVMNTPEGNTVSAAEHTLALLLALARNVPAAAVDTKNGNWNRKKFTGIEVENKVLGIVGLGKIGQHVARGARALGMRVTAYDPYISAERAEQLNVQLCDLDQILKESDFVTLHVPKTAATVDLIDAAALKKMKPSARIINVARGGIVNEADLAAALEAGTIAGAAIDVFSTEPITADNPLLKAPNIILTPHLGASTIEAQEKVAEGIARQFATFFEIGMIQNAVNVEIMLSPELSNYGILARLLGSLAVQMLPPERVLEVKVTSQGSIAKLDTRAVAVSGLSGVLARIAETDVNLVNASQTAHDRGIELKEERSRKIRNYANLITLEVITEKRSRSVSGTCFDDKQPRIVMIDNMEIDLKPAENILVMRYQDRPGMVGKFGSILGEAGINIARMEVGRVQKGAEALVALTLDDPVPEEIKNKLAEAVQPSEIFLVSLNNA